MKLLIAPKYILLLTHVGLGQRDGPGNSCKGKVRLLKSFSLGVQKKSLLPEMGVSEAIAVKSSWSEAVSETVAVIIWNKGYILIVSAVPQKDEVCMYIYAYINE